MNFRLDPPAELRGTADEKLRQIYSYLFCLSENLNISLKAPDISDEKGGAQSAFKDHAVYAQIRNTEEALRTEIETKVEPISAELAAHKKAPVYPVRVE